MKLWEFIDLLDPDSFLKFGEGTRAEDIWMTAEALKAINEFLQTDIGVLKFTTDTVKGPYDSYDNRTGAICVTFKDGESENESV